MKQQIQPAYATFEQAKKLKEKGFNVPCVNYYTPEFTVHGFNTSLINSELGDFYSAPEQWQIVEWLRVNHGIWVSVDMIYETSQIGFWYCIRQSKEDDKAIDSNEYPTPTEAYQSAFDYILNNLI